MIEKSGSLYTRIYLFVLSIKGGVCGVALLLGPFGRGGVQTGDNSRLSINYINKIIKVTTVLML
jgi:hypothetical protein